MNYFCVWALISTNKLHLYFRDSKHLVMMAIFYVITRPILSFGIQFLETQFLSVLREQYDSKFYKILWKFTSIQNIQYKLMDRDDMIRFSKFWTTLCSSRKRCRQHSCQFSKKRSTHPSRKWITVHQSITLGLPVNSIESNWSIDDLQKDVPIFSWHKKHDDEVISFEIVKMCFVIPGLGFE